MNVLIIAFVIFAVLTVAVPENVISWSCIKNRDKTFLKITEILNEMNAGLETQGVKLGTRNEYAIEYVELLLEKYISLVALEPEKIIRGRGHHKSNEQRLYERLKECLDRLKKYAKQIEICGMLALRIE